jgi:hypothetical protein
VPQANRHATPLTGRKWTMRTGHSVDRPWSLTDHTPAASISGSCKAAGTGRRRDGRPQPPQMEVGLGQAVLMAETSNSRVTLSLTRTPPVSSATFQMTS